MKKVLLPFMGLIPIIFLTGCFNDPKEANIENFSKAINAYLVSDKQKLNCFRIGFNFPLEEGFMTTKESLDKKVKEGFLEAKTIKVKKRYSFSESLARRTKKLEPTYVDKKVYDLTSNSKAYYSNGSICIGSPKLDKVVNFSEPGKVGPYTFSKVKYTYNIDNLPKWVSMENNIKTKSNDFILTNNGWIHNKLYK